jgi:hypothetical protein
LSEKVLELFKRDLRVVNVGLEIFKEAMDAQSVSTVHVAWKPIPKLEKIFEDILDKIL